LGDFERLHNFTNTAFSNQEQIQDSDASVQVSELPVIEADPEQMRRLLQQLIENALKFRLPGKRHSVNIYSKQDTPAWVQILVEDTGIGFDDENAEHIFKPFKRLVGKSQSGYPGTGIGLAICRWIVEYHGGEITARSIPGEGTTVYVTLPVHQSDKIDKDKSHENGK